MPLLSNKSIHEKATLILWEIEESEQELLSAVTLHPSDREKFQRLKNVNKRREFLALRCCLKHFFGENPPVFYTTDGKPYLQSDYKISFSHSHQFAGMIVSPITEVGIDLELYREGILRIAHKFMRTEEENSIKPETRIPHLTYYWGAKEVMVKITGDRKHNFIKDLLVEPFAYKNHSHSHGKIKNEEYNLSVELFFEKEDQLYITYGWATEPTKAVSQRARIM